MDPRDPLDATDGGGEPPDVMLDFGAPLEPEAEPDPNDIPEAEALPGFEVERTENGGQRNQNWLGGVVTVIILVGLFGMFRSIMMGNFAVMLACAIILVALPLMVFVAFSGWRAGSATKNSNSNKKEGK